MQAQNAFLLNVEAPVDAVPARGHIRVDYLRGLDRLVRTLGGNPAVVFERHAIDLQAFEDPYRDHEIECTAAVNLFEDCSRSLGDPLFGLHLAEHQDPDVLGGAMALARSAPTLRAAVQSLIDYVPVCTSPECEMELVSVRDTVELRWRTDTKLTELAQVNLQGLLLFMKTLRTLGREHFRPRYASVMFALKPAQIREIEARLGCRVHTRADAHAIAFAADGLDRPIASANHMLFKLLSNCLPQLQAAARSGFAEQVEAQVRSTLNAEGMASVARCADRLGVSSRTLQKRLTKMGLKFSEIVQKQRIELAKQALLWSDANLDDIAFRLGYAEQTSFGRAFKRATGATPQAFRQSRRAH